MKLAQSGEHLIKRASTVSFRVKRVLDENARKQRAHRKSGEGTGIIFYRQSRRQTAPYLQVPELVKVIFIRIVEIEMHPFH